MNNIVFSEDKSTFGIITENGLYINTTGRPIEDSELIPHTMRCFKCGTIYKNATLRTVPKPCACGGIGFETLEDDLESL